MKCDIIIPIWDQLEHTQTCIENIIKNTLYPYRLILIDNASGDDTRKYLESLKNRNPLDVELIRNEENLGFVKAVNQGLKISSAPYICILNNDTIPAPGWLEKMIDFAIQHRDVGLVNPQCNGHGNVPIGIYAKTLEKYKGKYMEMNQCQGFCMLIKREVIDRIGYLDEIFGIGGFDDTDYSMRANIAGYRCVAIKEAYVYHRLHASFDKSGNREDWVRRNQKIYYKKWGKHLRIGIAVSLDRPSDYIISNVLLFSYGLAREWSWVHIWIHQQGKKDLMLKKINEILDINNLPFHQNIRIGYFDFPRPIFGITIASKLLERMRSHMKDKRFDVLIVSDESLMRFMYTFAKISNTHIIKLPFIEKNCDWQKKGRETALFIKNSKSKNEEHQL